MKEQVTSIEQSKRLIELGVPAEKASMVWETISFVHNPTLLILEANTDMKYWQVDNLGPRLHDRGPDRHVTDHLRRFTYSHRGDYK